MGAPTAKDRATVEGAAAGDPDARAGVLLWDDVPEAPRGRPVDEAGAADGRRAPKPTVSPDALMRMASFYLARYSASTARLREVLERKVRRRCELADAPLPEPAEMRALIDGVVDRLTRGRLIDDAAYGRGRAAALARKGLPAWRIKADLGRQDVDVAEPSVAEALDLDEPAQAARLAQRKRLGPYRPGEREPYRDKDVRALVRAGFPVGLAKRIVDGEAE